MSEANKENLEEPWTEEALRAEIQKGIDDLEQGRYRTFDDAGLAQYFEGVRKRGRERLKRQTNPY